MSMSLVFLVLFAVCNAFMDGGQCPGCPDQESQNTGARVQGILRFLGACREGEDCLKLDLKPNAPPRELCSDPLNCGDEDSASEVKKILGFLGACQDPEGCDPYSDTESTSTEACSTSTYSTTEASTSTVSTSTQASTLTTESTTTEIYTTKDLHKPRFI